MDEKYKKNENPADIRDVFKVLIKRKVVFFISFAVILIMSLSYTFLVGPNYLSVSKIKISNLDTGYNNTINRFFPDEAGALFIFSTLSIEKAELSKLNVLLNQIKYGDIMDNITGISGKKYLKKDVLKAMDLRINNEEQVLDVNIYSKNPNEAFEINKAIVDNYQSIVNSNIQKSYSDLLSKIDALIIDKNKTLDDLLAQAEKYVTDYNLSFLEKLKKSDLTDLNFVGINYLPPNLAMTINNTFVEVTDLSGAKNILMQNKDLFLKRIEIVKSPALADVADYSNFVRNIVLSIVISLLFAAIISFIVNYFKAPRQQ